MEAARFPAAAVREEGAMITVVAVIGSDDSIGGLSADYSRAERSHK